MGPRGGVVTQRSAKPFTPVQFWSWPPSIKSEAYRGIRGKELNARSEPVRAEVPGVRRFADTSFSRRRGSAGGVPAIRERDQRPGEAVVVGGLQRALRRHHGVHEILLRNRRYGRIHGIQHSFELCFSHDALRHSSAKRRKSSFFRD